MKFVVLLLSLSSLAWAQTVAIVGATLHGDQKVEEGTLVIRDGRIVAMGKEVPVPPDARAISAQGKQVTAGLVDAMSTLGLVEVDLVADTNEGNFEGREPIHAAYRVLDGYNPASVVIPVMRSGGITSVVAVPRGGLVSGQSAWMTLKADTTAAHAAAKESAAMHVTLGAGSLASAQGSRGLAVEMLRELLFDARAYARNRSAYEKNQLRALSASRLDLEALLPVVEGRIPLVVRVDRAADILSALRVMDEFGIRMIVAGGAEAWTIAGELAARRVGVILAPTENLPDHFDRIHVRDDAAQWLFAAGVDVAFSIFGSFPGAHRLRQTAGVAVAHGLAHADALAAITSIPARLFGIQDRGVLKVGARADVVLWSGDPLELSSRPEAIFIDGVPQPLESRQTELLRRYRHLR